MDERVKDRPATSRRVLVVDDDSGLRALIVKSLKKAGFDVQDLSSGACAVKSVAEDPSLVLLLDQKLTDMTGYDVIRALSQQGVRVPFIMMTGQGDERLAVEMMKLGAADYLVKDLELTDRLPGALERVFYTIETEQKLRAAEAELKVANTRLEALWNISLLSEADLKTISDYVLATISKMTDSAYSFYGFVNEDESAMTIHAWSGGAMQDCSVADKPCCYPVSEAGVWGEAIRQRKPLILNDYSAEHPAKKGLPQGHVRLTNLLVVPFMPQGRIVSVAAVANRKSDYSQNDVVQITLFLSNVQIIVNKKRAEEALRERDIQFKKLSSQVPGMIYQFMQRPDGSFCVPYSSEGIRAIYGCSPQDVRDDISPIIRRIVQQDHEVVFSTIEASARDLSLWQCEFRVQAPGGPIRWILGRSLPERLDDGTTVWHGFITDITERKQAEEEREKLRAQLLQAQKMESVGRLAGGVAHDFNNMLAVIIGNTEMALEKVAPDDPLQEDLKEIFSSAKRSADITRQLLAFARKQTIAPKVLDLNETIEGMLKMLRRLIGENIDLAWLPETGLWPVRMDPTQIDQILANLCVNARDAIADVGRITIETGKITIEQAYCDEHAGFTPGDFALLAVSDNGCGMPPETLNNLFEPFFTTKEINKGTGLGLATIYGIVKQNNGFINVYSEPGNGTTFKIYLPKHETAADQLRKKDPAALDARGSETILLVEDEPAILKIAKRTLERLGYTVLTANTAAQAMDLAAEHAGKIHLIITDVIMPEMNGRELAQKLLSLYPSLKCLFMSGYTANAIAHHGVLDHGVQYIQKPFSMKDIAAKVRAVLDHA